MVLIRKEIKQDGTFGGNYPYSIDYPTLPIKFIEITEGQRDYIDSHLDILRYDESQDGIFDNPKGIVDFSNSLEYFAKQLEKEKQNKLTENEQKAYAFIDSLIFHYEKDFKLLDFKCNKETQNDLTTAGLGFASGTITQKQWTTSNAITVFLSQEDVAHILYKIGELIDPAWEKWGNYVNQINNAESLKELNAVVIDYTTI